MLCEICKKQDATVHLTQTTQGSTSMLGLPPGQKELHMCEACADNFFAAGQDTNYMRNLICLSDFYRSKLYDLLESNHPKAFYHGESIAKLHKASETMEAFMREQFKKDNIQVGEDAFQMLRADFCFSHHYYTRADDYHKRHPDLT